MVADQLILEAAMMNPEDGTYFVIDRILLAFNVAHWINVSVLVHRRLPFLFLSELGLFG